MSGLYGYGNIVTQSGDYQLFPVLWVAGVVSSGGGGVTFQGDTVQASLSFAPALIGAINPYSVTAKTGANVTIASPGNTLIGALTGSTFNADGGTITISGADAISALSGVSYNITNAGTLNLNTIQGQSAISALSGSSVKFGAGGGTLVIKPGSNVSILAFKSISGFENDGATIKIPGATGITSVSKNGDSTDITTDNVYTITVKGDFYDYEQNHNLYQLAKDGSLYISSSPRNNTNNDGVLVCFLSGSMIRTSKGDVAVEDIQIGDKLVAFDWKNNKHIVRSVIWIGKARAIVRPELSDDEAGWPVRIIKDAIAEGIPYKDMLITAEHSLFFQDKFVPARMLVNGCSIFYDRSIQSYDYFHIETENHSVIWADGMMTESYLDTGNRKTFAQEGSVVRLFPKGSEKTWHEDAAATLCVERDFVEPLFTTLADRAAAKGLASQAEVLEVTPHSDIHLVVAQGQIIRPARQMKDSVVFMLPADVTAVRIVTHTSSPSETIGPFVDDRRQLGVLIGQVTLFDGKTNHAVTTHLDQEHLLGWDVQESVPCRWTNGDAILPLPSVRSPGLQILTLQIVAAGPYVIKKTDKKVQSLKTIG